jgi:hypothetical protein
MNIHPDLSGMKTEPMNEMMLDTETEENNEIKKNE